MEPASEKILRSTYLSRKPASGARLTTVTSMAVLCLTSVAYWENFLGMTPYLRATPELVFSKGEYWRLFTTMLIHVDFGHLAGNAFAFSLLSFLLNGYFGFWVHPVGSLVGGAIVNAISLTTYPPQAGLLGASGMVYLMAGFWVTLYFFTDRRFSRASRLLRSVGFSLAVFAPTSFEPTVSYRTHGIGFAVGLLSGALYFLARRKFIRGAEVYEVEVWEPTELS